MFTTSTRILLVLLAAGLASCATPRPFPKDTPNTIGQHKPGVHDRRTREVEPYVTKDKAYTRR